MYEKDYLKRIIQQAAHLAGTKIAQILGLIEEKEYLNAIEQLDGAFMSFYGMDSSMLKILSADTVIDTLTSENEEPDPARLLVLAELLKLEGDAYLGEDNPAEASRSFHASLDLYLSVAERTGITENRLENSHVAELATFLKKSSFPNALQLRLMKYYQSDLQYGKAEDELHEMLDQDDVSEEVIREGKSFYEDLLKLGDEELEKGEIYRAELLEGLEEIRGIELGE